MSQESLQALSDRVKFIEDSTRVEACSKLWTGSVFGLTGFGFAFVLGVLNMWGNGPFGHGYFPATVSEMVHDPASAAGKAFFACELVGAVCIFLSNYPYHLKNVYIGDDEQTVFRVSWTTARQYMPPIGMMLVACCPVTPSIVANIGDNISLIIHTAGAFFMFIGYVFFEGKTIEWGPFECIKKIDFKEGEQEMRKAMVTGLCTSFSLFLFFQVVLGGPWASLICCGDNFVNTHQLDDEGREILILREAAYSTFFWMKIASYTCEVLAGIFLIVSMLIIWYHSSERHIDMAENIPDFERPLLN